MFRAGRITESEASNYEFFFKTVARSKIPIILVVTNCEQITPMSKWGINNAHIFANQGLEYKDIVCTCCGTTEVPEFLALFEKLRNESYQEVIKAVETYATENSIILYNSKSSFLEDVIVVVFKWLAKFTGANSFMLGLLDWLSPDNFFKGMFDVLNKMGFSPEEATQMTKDIDKNLDNLPE